MREVAADAVLGMAFYMRKLLGWSKLIREAHAFLLRTNSIPIVASGRYYTSSAGKCYEDPAGYRFLKHITERDP